MKKTLLFFIFIAVFGILFFATNARYWTLPPAQKFSISVAEDLNLLEQKHFLPEAWQKIQKISLTSDASHVSNWLDEKSFQIPLHQNGEYVLEIFVSEWIDGYRYGALVEYDLVNIKNKNTVWELNRTYKLGFLY
jgi:hypothetical protein